MNVLQVFESYPVFYQPYIPPTIDVLSMQEDVNLKIIAFKGKPTSKDTVIFPSYNKRRIIEHFLYITKIKKVKYSLLEIYALKKKIDIIHLQHSYLYEKVLKILELPRNVRPKVIITLRGGDTYIKPWVQKKWSDFYKTYGNKVDAFITMSNDQKNYLTQWGVSQERIHVIPISFGENFSIGPKKPNPDKLKIISVFRMCWEKNIPDNLRLIKHLKLKGINVQYDIYGDGNDIGQVYYLIDKYQLNENARVLGKIENSTLKEKFRQYDFILQLSHSESLGMSIIEALSYGLPAIVSNAGGLSEVVVDNLTGFVFEEDFDFQKASNTIIEKWKKEDEYHIMSKNAIEFSHSKFNVNEEVIKLVELYKKLLK